MSIRLKQRLWVEVTPGRPLRLTSTIRAGRLAGLVFAELLAGWLLLAVVANLGRWIASPGSAYLTWGAALPVVGAGIIAAGMGGAGILVATSVLASRVPKFRQPAPGFTSATRQSWLAEAIADETGWCRRLHGQWAQEARSMIREQQDREQEDNRSWRRLKRQQRAMLNDLEVAWDEAEECQRNRWVQHVAEADNRFGANGRIVRRPRDGGWS